MIFHLPRKCRTLALPPDIVSEACAKCHLFLSALMANEVEYQLQDILRYETSTETHIYIYIYTHARARIQRQEEHPRQLPTSCIIRCALAKETKLYEQRDNIWPSTKRDVELTACTIRIEINIGQVMR